MLSEKNEHLSFFEKIIYTVGGFFSVFILSWLIYFILLILEKILHTQAIVSKDTTSITYDPIFYFLWKIIHALNGPVLFPIINLVFIALIGFTINYNLSNRQKKYYFFVPFMIAFLLNIGIGIYLYFFSNV